MPNLPAATEHPVLDFDAPVQFLGTTRSHITVLNEDAETSQGTPPWSVMGPDGSISSPSNVLVTKVPSYARFLDLYLYATASSAPAITTAAAINVLGRMVPPHGGRVPNLPETPATPDNLWVGLPDKDGNFDITMPGSFLTLGKDSGDQFALTGSVFVHVAGVAEIAIMIKTAADLGSATGKIVGSFTS